jgi:hypothetical protein
MQLNSLKYLIADKKFNLKINIMKAMCIILKAKFIKMKIWILLNGNPMFWTIWIHVIFFNLFIFLGNIKANTPYKFSRVIRANVPLPSSNIPFMPKFVDSK